MPRGTHSRTQVKGNTRVADAAPMGNTLAPNDDMLGLFVIVVVVVVVAISFTAIHSPANTIRIVRRHEQVLVDNSTYIRR